MLNLSSSESDLDAASPVGRALCIRLRVHTSRRATGERAAALWFRNHNTERREPGGWKCFRAPERQPLFTVHQGGAMTLEKAP